MAVSQPSNVSVRRPSEFGALNMGGPDTFGRGDFLAGRSLSQIMSDLNDFCSVPASVPLEVLLQVDLAEYL